MTLSTLFPLSPPDMVSDRLRAVLDELRHSVSELARPPPTAPAPPVPNPKVSEEEFERLQTIISSLKEELGMSLCQINTGRIFTKHIQPALKSSLLPMLRIHKPCLTNLPQTIALRRRRLAI